MDRGNRQELSGLFSYGAGRGLAGAEFDLAQDGDNENKSAADLEALTTIQQNNFTLQSPYCRHPITLTIFVTSHPSTSSRQHHFPRAAPLLWRGEFIFAGRFGMGLAITGLPDSLFGVI
jgi:hypothetical protein